MNNFDSAEVEDIQPNEFLPFSIPRRVPKWVTGFFLFIANTLNYNPQNEVLTVHDKWIKYEVDHWELYQKHGKPRKPRQPKVQPNLIKENEDVDGMQIVNDDNSSEPPTKRKRGVRRAKLKSHINTLRKLAETLPEHMKGPLCSELDDLEREVEQDDE